MVNNNKQRWFLFALNTLTYKFKCIFIRTHHFIGDCTLNLFRIPADRDFFISIFYWGLSCGCWSVVVCEGRQNCRSNYINNIIYFPVNATPLIMLFDQAKLDNRNDNMLAMPIQFTQKPSADNNGRNATRKWHISDRIFANEQMRIFFYLNVPPS